MKNYFKYNKKILYEKLHFEKIFLYNNKTNQSINGINYRIKIYHL